MHIPLHVLKTIISRAKHNDLLKQRESQFILTKKGEESLHAFEDEEDVRRRIESLMQDIVTFFGDNDVVITTENAYDIVNAFIQSNLKGLIDYLNPTITSEILNTSGNGQSKEHEKLLVTYFMKAQASKPNEYDVLKEMVYGSIISKVLDVSETTNINEIKSPLKNCVIYLDSNIALSVLGLTSAERNEPASRLSPQPILPSCQ